jgi:LuxR family transcriptional regulator, maltose regulon positive regulatory protein
VERLGPATTVPAERLPAMERLVPRRALFDALSSVRGGQVVLLCAPAGSGKTVLLRSWMRSGAGRDPVAWVSVERDEEDAQHFWLSVIDALAGAVHEEGVVERVSATPAFRGDGVIEPLLSSLDELEEPRRADDRRPPRAALARSAAAAGALPRPDPADAARGAVDAS